MTDPKPLSEAEERDLRASLALRAEHGGTFGVRSIEEADRVAFLRLLATLDAERASRPETTGYIPGMQYGTGGTRQTWEHYAASRPEPDWRAGYEDGKLPGPRTRPEPGADLAGLPECGTCHGDEWVDNGCGVVPCPECSVSASTYAAARGVTVSPDLAAAIAIVDAWASRVCGHHPAQHESERLVRALAALPASPECWCLIETATHLGGGVNPHCPQHGAALPASPESKEHRPEWLDDVPTGYCVCGEPWQVNHARLAALKEPTDG